ncbi:MAG: hypothetical protein ACYDET_04980 [Thermoleophilia bacterium]
MKLTKKKYFIFAFFVVAISSYVILQLVRSSSKEVTSNNVVGNYVANYPKDKVTSDTLQIRNDGTYSHDFASSDGKANFTQQGKWHLDFVDLGVFGTRPEILFDNFTVDFPHQDIPETGGWGATVEADGFTFSPVPVDGEIGFHGYRLLISFDNGYYYDKQE